MGLQIIKPDTHIDFVGVRKIAFILSAVVILAGLGSLLIQGGPKYGIDFAGGIIVQVKIDKDTNVDTVKDAVKDLDLPGLVVQTLGLEGDHEYLIRTLQLRHLLRGGPGQGHRLPVRQPGRRQVRYPTTGNGRPQGRRGPALQGA